MREREAKLVVPPAFRMPQLDGLGAGVHAQPGEQRRLDTVYLDTADLRLARWGATLRHRAGAGWTVKLPAEPEDGPVLDRDERSFEGDRQRPPQEALELVRAFARSAPLEQVARIRTRRRPVRLHDGDGGLLAEVADDEVSVMDGRRVAARFREVEVEVTPGAPDGLLETVVAVLADAGAEVSEPLPKHVRALGPAAAAPPEPALPDLPAAPTPGDVVRRALAASVVRLIRHDPGTRLGEDPEALHQMRVATRRLRSDLRTFRPLLDAQWAGDLRDELRWLGGLLGTVRDPDVLAERLAAAAADAPPDVASGADALRARLARERDRARDALLEGLRSDRYAALLDRLVDAASAPRLLDGTAGGDSAAVLAGLVAGPWKGLRKAVRRLGEPPLDEELHRVRIRTKRARYAAEAVAPALGRPAARFARAAARLQDILGDHQDAVVAGVWLRDAATPATGFAAGWLAGVQAAEAARCRQDWQAAWKRVRKRRPSTW